MQSKKETLEFLDSLRKSKEWTKDEQEIITQIYSEVNESETYGQLKKAFVKAIKLIPYIIEFLKSLGGT